LPTTLNAFLQNRACRLLPRAHGNRRGRSHGKRHAEQIQSSSTSVILSAAPVTATPNISTCASQLSRQDFHVSQAPHQEPEKLVLHRFGWRCAGCHKPWNEPWDTQFDHVVPLAAANTDPAFMRTWQLNHVHAFQPLCRRCQLQVPQGTPSRAVHVTPRLTRTASVTSDPRSLLAHQDIGSASAATTSFSCVVASAALPHGFLCSFPCGKELRNAADRQRGRCCAVCVRCRSLGQH
jgi:hypothetical protein